MFRGKGRLSSSVGVHAELDFCEKKLFSCNIKVDIKLDWVGGCHFLS